MRSGNVLTSRRLQKVLRVLDDLEWHTSLEISKLTHNPAVSATITDLRNNGITIEREYAGLSGDGQRMHRYKLIPEVGQIDLGLQGIKGENYG